jgi:hypothetical protein
LGITLVKFKIISFGSCYQIQEWEGFCSVGPIKQTSFHHWALSKVSNWIRSFPFCILWWKVIQLPKYGIILNLKILINNVQHNFIIYNRPRRSVDLYIHSPIRIRYAHGQLHLSYHCHRPLENGIALITVPCPCRSVWDFHTNFNNHFHYTSLLISK